MGIGGAIGTGLFLGVGRALATAGPLSMLLGFIITGMAVWGMVWSLIHSDPRRPTVSES
jgi:yeast amino acid transporter